MPKLEDIVEKGDGRALTGEVPATPARLGEIPPIKLPPVRFVPGVPADNPRMRERALIEDRLFGNKYKKIAHLRYEALGQLRQMTRAMQVVAPTVSMASNWVQLGPLAIPNGQTYGGSRVLVSGRVTAIAIDPTDTNTIYVGGARGGVWKTTDGGKTYTPTGDNEVSLAIGTLAMAKSKPQTLYAGTGEGNVYYYVSSDPLDSLTDSYYGNGVLVTTNGGGSWTNVGATTFMGASFFRIAVDPTNDQTVFTATTAGVHRSSDGGGSWTQLTSGLPTISGTILGATDVVIDPTNTATVYVAFWGDGIYQSTNADTATPTFTKLTTGLPSSNMSRISLGISPSSGRVYAMIADSFDGFNGLYRTVDGTNGADWESCPTGISINVYGAYTSNVAVDPTTPDVVYLSGVSLYKGIRNSATDAWTFTDIGEVIHPDNHDCVIDPTNAATLYAGTDGGFYKSSDGGSSFIDAVNQGLCLAQFEFIAQHPTSDAVMFGGTQDNGTEQFRNSVVFNHAADGDGGYALIDPSNPDNVIHTYYGESPERSTQGGKFGTWSDVSSGLTGSSTFYPPVEMDQTNSNNLCFGTTVLCLDGAQGTGGWPTDVALPGITGRVTAITYVNSTLIYCGTSAGEVYCAVYSGGSWTATAIGGTALPNRWIWDIATLPGDVNTVILVMSGFGTAHVWRGAVTGGTSASWTDVSGVAPNRLPDIPVNALVIDPSHADRFYIGTDIGVFLTTDSGTSWAPFTNGLPNTAVNDLKLHQPTRLLRAATHGRGIWERKIDAGAMPDVDVYVRDNPMLTGRILPSPYPVYASFEDLLQEIHLNDELGWWECADIKVDALSGSPPSYQMNVSDVTYLTYETALTHRNPERGQVNRVYVQVHNRGIAPTTVTVKIQFADATPGLPDLPADYWMQFPNDSADLTHWHPVGTAQTVTVSPLQPAILEWDWTVPMSAADHSCMLVVTDTTDDPIPAANKTLVVGDLVANEKRVGLHNLHVVTPSLPSPIYWVTLNLLPLLEGEDIIRILPSRAQGWHIGVTLPTEMPIKLVGFEPLALKEEHAINLRAKLGNSATHYDPRSVHFIQDLRSGGMIRNLPRTREGIKAMFAFIATDQAQPARMMLVHEYGGRILGGNTFVLRPPTPLRKPSGNGFHAFNNRLILDK